MHTTGWKHYSKKQEPIQNKTSQGLHSIQQKFMMLKTASKTVQKTVKEYYSFTHLMECGILSIIVVKIVILH